MNDISNSSNESNDDNKKLTLSSLPIDILSLLLSSYLDPISFINFDSSFSGKKRDLLFNTISKQRIYSFENYRHNLKSLWYLALRGITKSISILRYDNTMTDTVLSSLSYCYIQHIDLQGCKSVSNISCLKKCKLLQILNCNDCHLISDNSIINITSSCNKLTKLYFNDCTLLTDKAITAISDNCKNLKVLFITKCCEITANGIMLLKKNQELIELGLAHLIKITDAAVDCISQHCPHLEVLNLIGCNNLTDSSVISIADKCFRLREIGIS